MDFMDLAKQRYSVRAYKPSPVEREKLETIIQAGRIAPSAANKQPNHFLVLNTQNALDKLAKGTNSYGAPLAIITCSDKTISWVRPYDKQSMADTDAAIATTHMMLCAQDIGLSSCWLTYFDPEIITSELNIPPNLEPKNILVIGYSADEAPASPCRHDKTRKPPLVTYDSF